MRDVLKISTLGVMLIEQNGVPLSGFVSRKVEALLVYLACQPQAHARDVLTVFFWDDGTPGNLRTALSNLQQVVGSCVTVTRQTVTWNADSHYELDVVQLESVFEQVEHHVTQHQHFSQFTAQRLEAALSLYHGDFLAGFNLRDATGFDDWRLMEQERIRARVLKAWRLLLRYSYRLQHYEQGIRQARQILKLDLFDEDAYYHLMLMLAETGERKEALMTYATCQQLLQQELQIDPSSKLSSLARRITTEEVLVLPERVKQSGHMPTQATTFIDRPAEIQQINERLDDPTCRLLTLVGSGGIGKTRLAMNTAEQWQLDFPDGTYFIELAPLNDPAMLATTILASFKIPLSAKKDARTQLLDYLSDKKILLILDNFEHIAESASLLAEMLAHAPQLKILVTSRERLQLQEEWILSISGLEFPKTGKRITGTYNALALFEQSARRVVPTFDQTEHRKVVAEICRLVEGMPLAIELAAGWLRSISCQQIAEQIQNDLDILSTATRNIPERHRSIRSLFDFSWQMLTADEQQVFMRLGVFNGAFSRAAAGKVAGLTLPILTTLVEKSLLQQTSPDYYTMHELLRRYSAEKLTAQGDFEAVCAEHAAYYRQLVMDMHARVEIGQLVSNFETDQGNINQALVWVEGQGDLTALVPMTNGLIFFWDRRGYHDAARYWTLLAVDWLKPDTAPDLQAHVYLNASNFAWLRGELDQALDWSERGLAIAEAHDLKSIIKKALPILGHIHKSRGDFDKVRHYYEASLNISEAMNDELAYGRALNNLGNLAIETCDYVPAKDYISRSLTVLEKLNAVERLSTPLGNMGIIAYQEGDYAQAEIYFQKSVDMARQTNDRLNMALMASNLGEVAALQGNFALAKSALKDSLKTLYELSNKVNQVYVLEGYAPVLNGEGQASLAAFVLGAAEAAREQLNAPLSPNVRDGYEENVNQVRMQLSTEEFLANWQEGRATSLEDTVLQILYGG